MIYKKINTCGLTAIKLAELEKTMEIKREKA